MLSLHNTTCHDGVLIHQRFTFVCMFQISRHIVTCLNPFRRPDCKAGRISNTDDFKHLARKVGFRCSLCRNISKPRCGLCRKMASLPWCMEWFAPFVFRQWFSGLSHRKVRFLPLVPYTQNGRSFVLHT